MSKPSVGILDASTQIDIARVDPNELPDEPLIAATTLANRLPISTCNPAGFVGIDGLEVHAVKPPSS